MPQQNRGSSLLNTTLCMAIAGLVLWIVWSVFMTCGCPGPHSSKAKQSTCQSNLKQIGTSIKIYLNDWDNNFPSNRRRLANGKLGSVQNSIELSPSGEDKSGKKIVQKFGLNWVESLYNFGMEPAGESPSTWRCPNASTETYPSDSGSAAVSYVFNRNLVEKSAKTVREPGKLLMVREMDRLVNADLRPINDSKGSPKLPPISAFLNGGDNEIGSVHADLHNSGSNILFADGHVKYFRMKHILSACQWDNQTKAWYDYAPSKSENQDGRPIIMITP